MVPPQGQPPVSQGGSKKRGTDQVDRFQGVRPHAQVTWCSSLGDEGLNGGDDLIGVTAAAHAHGQGFTGVLVDDVQQLQASLVGGLVELEVQAQT